LDPFLDIYQEDHPVDQSNKTIITNQDKGSLGAIEDIVPLAGRFQCNFHCQQNLVKNAVVERDTNCSQQFGCTIYSAVATLLPCLRQPEKVQG
jgi:hypothetical protein